MKINISPTTFLLPAILAVCSANAVLSQSASSSSSQTPQAQQVQPSGRAQGGASVMAQQSAAASASSSVNTVNTRITVQGPYQGSVPGPAVAEGAVTLTLADAIKRGLQYNLGGLDSAASARQQRALRLSALSQMLPNIYATISESGAKTDLETQGLSSGVFGGGIALPTTVGPYHYYSAQANLTEQLSLTSLHNLRSATAARDSLNRSRAPWQRCRPPRAIAPVFFRQKCYGQLRQGHPALAGPYPPGQGATGFGQGPSGYVRPT